MANDIKTTFDQTTGKGDYTLEADGSLTEENGLETAVYLSLFTDARAAGGDELPDNSGDRRGWWGDNLSDGDTFGSKLWLLGRGKLTNQTLIQAKSYVQQALQWLIDDEVASKIDVSVEPQRTPANNFVLAISVAIWRGDVLQLNSRYAYVWEGVS